MWEEKCCDAIGKHGKYLQKLLTVNEQTREAGETMVSFDQLGEKGLYQVVIVSENQRGGAIHRFQSELQAEFESVMQGSRPSRPQEEGEWDVLRSSDQFGRPLVGGEEGQLDAIPKSRTREYDLPPATTNTGYQNSKSLGPRKVGQQFEHSKAFDGRPGATRREVITLGD